MGRIDTETLTAAPVGSGEFMRALRGAGPAELTAALEHAGGRARRRKLRAALRRMENVRFMRRVVYHWTSADAGGAP